MNEQLLRKRKLLTVLPLIAIPFLTLMFWALGGGKGTGDTVAAKKDGLNTSLPDAKLDDEGKDKLSLYDQALKDSLELEEARNADPYGRFGRQLPADSLMFGDTMNPLLMQQPGYGNYGIMGMQVSSADQTEARLRTRLAELESQLQQANSPQSSAMYGPSSAASHEMDELQASLAAGTVPGAVSEPDPELDKINSMLEKVMDIQNPQRAKDKLKTESQKNKGLVYAVTAPPDQTRADLFTGAGPSGRQATEGESGNTNANGQKVITAAFYEITDDVAADNEDNKAIPAVVHETQTLTSGATLKMRLLEDVYINGVMIPKGNYVFGTCMLEGERMNIEVKAFRYKNSLFPVSLAVYDMDGIEGVKIPGAITRDATKQGADQAMQSLDFSMMDQSLGAQAANAGVATAKSLFGRKTKLIRATIKAGYPVLLMDLNKRNQ